MPLATWVARGMFALRRAKEAIDNNYQKRYNEYINNW